MVTEIVILQLVTEVNIANASIVLSVNGPN